MSVVYLVFIAALDLAGVVFNVQLLWRCFTEKTQNSFLRSCRLLTIWQSACQVLIVAADAVESWKGFDFQPGENCNVFRALSMSMMLFQACNITVIMILVNDHRSPNRHGREASFKLKISLTISLGLVGSTLIWWYCFSQEFLVHVSAVATCAVTIIFVVYLFVAQASKTSSPEQSKDDISPEASKDPCHFSWNVCTEEKKHVSFIAVLLTFLLMIVFGVPYSSFHFKECLYLLMTRFTVGIVLPSTVSDVMDSSYERENENEEKVLIT